MQPVSNAIIVMKYTYNKECLTSYQNIKSNVRVFISYICDLAFWTFVYKNTVE